MGRVGALLGVVPRRRRREFEVARGFWARRSVVAWSIVPPKIMSAQWGSRRLTFRRPVRSVELVLVRLLTCLLCVAVQDSPRIRYAGMLGPSSVATNSTSDSTLLNPCKNHPKLTRSGATPASK